MADKLENHVVYYRSSEIRFQLERKQVKNLNLRIRADRTVYVSANPTRSLEQVEQYVLSKGEYILSSLRRFCRLAAKASCPKQHVSGETFRIQGRNVRLKVLSGLEEKVESDGVFLYLTVRDKNDSIRKERLVTDYLDTLCRKFFIEVVEKIYPIFKKYGVVSPQIRIRPMKTRWGSCQAQRGIITLNERLLEFPRNCVEYVVLHEFCHFIHSDHSKKFYDMLSVLMPDWKERKNELEKQGREN